MDGVVRDFFTDKVIRINHAYRFINDIIDGIKIFEYTEVSDKLISIRDRRDYIYYNKERFENHIIYDRSCGVYKISDTLSNIDTIYCKYASVSTYNYEFPKNYEAAESFGIFKDKQYLKSEEIDFKLSKFLKYTFGLEFETATGTIPQDICFRDGLIPLRDGSITGNEYSTVVLSGNKGLNLLKQQVDTLKDYTFFDKNCSLHVHIGGFKLSPEVLWNIYKNCVNLQNQLIMILPVYTFKSSEYKDTHKDYCKLLSGYRDFESLYKSMVGFPFLGSLTEPHPNDLEHARKWNIDKRYFWVNFINALCYSGGKTIEFRFLRPTYNLNKIIFWLYIFNAIIYMSENGGIVNSLEELVNTVYPEDIAKLLETNIIKTKICTETQKMLKDYIGERTDIEDRIFDTNELI